jgi:hypothetical protein
VAGEIFDGRQIERSQKLGFVVAARTMEIPPNRFGHRLTVNLFDFGQVSEHQLNQSVERDGVRPTDLLDRPVTEGQK